MPPFSPHSVNILVLVTTQAWEKRKGEIDKITITEGERRSREKKDTQIRFEGRKRVHRG